MSLCNTPRPAATELISARISSTSSARTAAASPSSELASDATRCCSSLREQRRRSSGWNRAQDHNGLPGDCKRWGTRFA